MDHLHTDLLDLKHQLQYHIRSSSSFEQGNETRPMADVTCGTSCIRIFVRRPLIRQSAVTKTLWTPKYRQREIEGTTCNTALKVENCIVKLIEIARKRLKNWLICSRSLTTALYDDGRRGPARVHELWIRIVRFIKMITSCIRSNPIRTSFVHLQALLKSTYAG